MKSFIQFLVFTTTVLFFVACGSKENKKGKEDLASLKKQQQEIQAKIATLENADTSRKNTRIIPVGITSMTPVIFNNYISVQGKVDVDEVVNAIPETPGIISAIFVKPGQYVRKGQVVASLRADIVNSGIAQLDVQINLAKVLYDKQKRLWDQEIGTEIQLLQAKTQYESLLKQKQTSLNNKNSFNVYSPINGVVDAVDATVGQSFASPMNPPVIKIVNTGKLKIKAQIPENYAGVVRTGSNVMLIFSDIHDTLLTKVNYAEKIISEVSRSFAVYIPLPSSAKYQPNMSALVKIATYQNARAFVLPASVIQKTENGNFVYVMDEKQQAKLREVSLGNSYESKVEILSGLTLGDQVITTGYEELNEGDQLKIEQ
ncbi:MAG TPA: efflux RND transporter periplasmic adaptor subunit [Chitinophagaceae bacterium]|jgi:RND family efflux transporter MFP subunit|nr:efflux RND transporter periplasmic adaptor subunit [Chitinophagaceae bacterium]